MLSPLYLSLSLYIYIYIRSLSVWLCSLTFSALCYSLFDLCSLLSALLLSALCSLLVGLCSLLPALCCYLLSTICSLPCSLLSAPCTFYLDLLFRSFAWICVWIFRLDLSLGPQIDVYIHVILSKRIFKQI